MISDKIVSKDENENETEDSTDLDTSKNINEPRAFAACLGQTTGNVDRRVV